MVTYGNILFCTDFSESAQAAVAFAVDLAKKYGARLHVIHVYREAGHIAEFELSSDVKNEPVTVTHFPGKEMEKKLEDLCRDISNEIGDCRRKILQGKPHAEIVRYAEEEHIDLVVMASHKLSGLEHALFGSTEEKVVRESPCDVFIIKRPLR